MQAPAHLHCENNNFFCYYLTICWTLVCDVICSGHWSMAWAVPDTDTWHTHCRPVVHSMVYTLLFHNIIMACLHSTLTHHNYSWFALYSHTIITASLHCTLSHHNYRQVAMYCLNGRSMPCILCVLISCDTLLNPLTVYVW